MLLPTLHGTDLSGKAREIPGDLGPEPIFLIFGFAHAAREDVGRWKEAFTVTRQPYLSLPTTPAELEDSVAAPMRAAMKAHVPSQHHGTIVQIHRGGAALLAALEWVPDLFAKVILTDQTGVIHAEHAVGPFTTTAFHSLMEAWEDLHRSPEAR